MQRFERFGACALDVPARMLERSGERQHLEPQAFDLLAYLVAHRDRVVPKSELLDNVWGGRFISDAALTTRVKEIRQATGDTGSEQAVIRTVRGRGYQFVAPIDPARLTDEGRVLPGRQRDVSEVMARITSPSLLTLVGPGGVGKSTLARLCARSAASDAGVTLIEVDLSVLEDARDLVPAVARAAGLADELQPLASLAGTRAVLLLDDADDLVAAVATLSRTVLETLGSSVCLVVTCRERLGVVGEQVWPVLPLSAPAAREVLLRRGYELAPRAGWDDLDEPSVNELTAAVDRLPLALEMVAATAALVGIDHVQRFVSESSAEVVSTRRDAPSRHRSLSALVAWSLDRLDPQLWEALVGLNAFAGSFSAEDGSAVLVSTDALAMIGTLADRSLVSPLQTSDGVRHQVLRTVRRGVVQRALPDEIGRAARRHAEFVTQTLEAADNLLRGPSEVAGAATFNRLADEARAAHSWAREHDTTIAARLSWSLHLYAYSRMWNEPAEWAQQLAGTFGEVPAKLLVVLATHAGVSGELAKGRALAERALAVPDVDDQLHALEVLSDINIYDHRFDEATTCAQQLVQVAQRANSARGEALGLTNLTLSRAYARDPSGVAGAIKLIEEMDTSSLAPSDESWLLFARGEALNLQGDERGIVDLLRSVALAESVGNPFVVGVAQDTLASNLARGIDPTASIPIYLEIVESFRRSSNVTHLTTFLREVVPVLDALEEDEAAATVAGWVLGPNARPVADHDASRIQEALGNVGIRAGDTLARQWASTGSALTVADAAQLVLEALLRHG